MVGRRVWWVKKAGGVRPVVFLRNGRLTGCAEHGADEDGNRIEDDIFRDDLLGYMPDDHVVEWEVSVHNHQSCTHEPRNPSYGPYRRLCNKMPRNIEDMAKLKVQIDGKRNEASRCNKKH